jgi:Zn-dependent protease with chaperone function
MSQFARLGAGNWQLVTGNWQLPLNEDKASRYHRLRRRSAVLSVALTASMLGGLLVSGGSASIADAAYRISATGHCQFSPMAVAVYVVILALLQETLAFPLAFYHGFFLDRRYGLSVEPPAAWFRDHAKAMGLGLILAIAGAEVVYAAVRVSPAWWWLIAAAAFVAAMAVMAKIAPVVLLPLFYKFTPLDRESLRIRLVSLSQRAGVPVLGVYEWAMGKKTRRANAALVGTGATRRIIVSDTLLAEYSDDEIEVILAHEIGHHVHRDILVALIAESALLVAAFYVAGAVLDASWERLGFRSASDIAALPLLLLAGGTLTVGATPVVNALSRWNERRADRYALRLTRRPAAFISAMKRLGTQNLAEERPSAAVRWLFHTHPPIEQRIKDARSIE